MVYTLKWVVNGLKLDFFPETPIRGTPWVIFRESFGGVNRTADWRQTPYNFVPFAHDTTGQVKVGDDYV